MNSSDYLLLTTQKPGCGFEMVDGKLSAMACVGGMIAHTITGSGLLQCGALDKPTYYGPVVVENQNCTDLLMGREIVGDHHSTRLNVASMNYNSILWQLALVALAMFAILECSIIRFAYLSGYLKSKYPSNEGEEQTSLLGCRIMKKSIEVDNELYGPRHGSLVSVKLSWCQILMWVLLFIKPQQVDTSMVVGMSEGMTISDGKGHISVLQSKVAFPLTGMYYTTIWETGLEKDWHWRSSGCTQNIQTCAASLPYGIRGGGRFWDQDGKKVIYHRFCKHNTESFLLLPVACVEWLIKIIVSPRNLYRVYSVDTGMLQLSLNVTSKPGCEIVSHESQLPIEVTDVTVIEDPHGSKMLCPFKHNYKNPMKNQLGDVQIDSGWATNTPSDLFTCVKEFNQDPECTLSRPALEKVLPECLRLPTDYRGLMWSMEKKFLVVRRNPSVLVTMNCDLGHQGFANTICGGVSLHINGIQDSPVGLIMVVRTQVVIDQLVWRGMVDCAGMTMDVPCDSKGVAIRIPSDSPCINDTFADINILANKHFSYVSNSHIGLTSDWSMPSSMMMDLGAVLRFFGVSSSTMIMVGVVIFYFLTRK